MCIFVSRIEAASLLGVGRTQTYLMQRDNRLGAHQRGLGGGQFALMEVIAARNRALGLSPPQESEIHAIAAVVLASRQLARQA